MKVYQSNVFSEKNFMIIIITPYHHWETFSIEISCAAQTILRGPGPRRSCVRATDLTRGRNDFNRTLSQHPYLHKTKKNLEWGRPLFEGVTDHFQSFMGRGQSIFKYFRGYGSSLFSPSL